MYPRVTFLERTQMYISPQNVIILTLTLLLAATLAWNSPLRASQKGYPIYSLTRDK